MIHSEVFSTSGHPPSRSHISGRFVGSLRLRCFARLAPLGRSFGIASRCDLSRRAGPTWSDSGRSRFSIQPGQWNFSEAAGHSRGKKQKPRRADVNGSIQHWIMDSIRKPGGYSPAGARRNRWASRDLSYAPAAA